MCQATTVRTAVPDVAQIVTLPTGVTGLQESVKMDVNQDGQEFIVIRVSMWYGSGLTCRIFNMNRIY